MSGYKYSDVVLAAERARRLEEAKARREEKLRRRRAEEARRRVQALARANGVLVQAVGRALASLERDGLLPFAPGGEDSLRGRVEAASGVAVEPTVESETRRQTELLGLQAELGVARARAIRARLEDERRRIAAGADRARGILRAAMDTLAATPPEAGRLCPEERRAADAAVSAAANVLARAEADGGWWEEAGRAADAAMERVSCVALLYAERAAEQAQARSALEQAHAELASRLQGLRESGLARWSKAESAGMEVLAAEAAAALVGDAQAAVLRAKAGAVEAAAARAAALEETALELESREARRSVIVDGFVQSFVELGYQVQSEPLAESEPESDRILRAVDPAGSEIVVRFSLSDRVVLLSAEERDDACFLECQRLMDRLQEHGVVAPFYRDGEPVRPLERDVDRLDLPGTGEVRRL